MWPRCSRCFEGELIDTVGKMVERLDELKANRASQAKFGKKLTCSQSFVPCCRGLAAMSAEQARGLARGMGSGSMLCLRQCVCLRQSLQPRKTNACHQSAQLEVVGRT